MNYPKSLFYNFLTVYFVNHLLPGLDVMHPTRLPHFGADLPFALAVGLLNSLIYPICKLACAQVTAIKLALIAFILNFAIYALLKIVPLGIYVTTIQGYLLASIVVTAASFAMNYLYMRKARHHHPHKGSDIDPHGSSHSIHKFDE